MQRMGMVLGLKPDKVAEYKRLHAAVWPDVLKMISACNIRNYSIYLKQPENLLFAISNITAPISPPTWRRWRPTRRRRNGGPSACRARSRSRPARKANGGP